MILRLIASVCLHSLFEQNMRTQTGQRTSLLVWILRSQAGWGKLSTSLPMLGTCFVDFVLFSSLFVCSCGNVLVVMSRVQVLNQVKASGKGNTPAQMEALWVNLVPDPLLGYWWISAASLASWISSISLKGNLTKTFLMSFYIVVLSICVSHVRSKWGHSR